MDFLNSLFTYKNSQKTAIVYGDFELTYKDLIENALHFCAYLSKFRLKNVIIKTARSTNSVVAALGVIFSGGVYAFLSDKTPDEYVKLAVQDLNADLIIDDNIDFSDYTSFLYDLSLVKRDGSDNICAVFTSGSTGRPKGALLTYRALCETVSWQTKYMNLIENSHTASYARFSFIAAFWELWYPLANGFTFHIAEEKYCLDTKLLCDFIEEKRIAYIFLPSSVAEIFTSIYNGTSLKFLRVAGGRLSSCSAPKGYQILYSLGMSENSGSVTLNVITSEKNGDISIGKPFNNTEIYLIDGEIAVSGPSLFSGYAGQKEQTEMVLVPNPYAVGRAFYEKMYMSGDLAEKDANGDYFYKGRRDFLVKINNIKTNPLETERVILENSGVKEAVVKAEKREDESAVLVCFYTGSVSEKELEIYVKERLLPTSVPSFFIKSNGLPKNSNGKIDRNSLHLPTQNINEKPMSNEEKIIAFTFEKVLSLTNNTVGPNDSFFHLGGNSLGLMRLQAELYKNAGLDLRYTDILGAQTPHEISLIKAQNSNSIITTKPVINKPYPLTAPERQMWLLWRTGQDNGRYTVRIRCDFIGEIDMERANIALEKLTKMNPILSSYYATQKDIVSRYFSDREFTFTEEEPITFDLNSGPLFTAKLQNNSIIFTAHHIIADAAAMRVLAEDFWNFYYNNEVENAVQFHDLELHESSRNYNDEKEFWAKELDGFSYIPLPSEDTSDETKELVISFSETEISTLKNLASNQNITLFKLFTAATATLISLIQKREKVCLGVPFSGRDLPETIRTVGMLVRTLPLIIPVSAEFSKTVKQAVECIDKAFLHQNYPFEIMNEIYGVRYDVMVNFIPLPEKINSGYEHSPKIIRGSYNKPAVPLVIDLREEENGLSAVFTYDSLSSKTIENWAEIFTAILLSKTPPDVIIPQKNHVANASGYSAELAVIWEDMLGDLSGGFYELGGTSLKAIKIEEAMLEQGLYISAADILSAQTFSDISKLVSPADEIDWEAE
jgi:acyl-coenzyme A synthetase/AMP-(fatty) acid ligase